VAPVPKWQRSLLTSVAFRLELSRLVLLLSMSLGLVTELTLRWRLELRLLANLDEPC
jgi:hypothetical protein